MPQIAPNTFKATTSYYWYREYANGKVDAEFNEDTGQIKTLDNTQDKLKRVGWIPVSQELATKMEAFGEFGRPPTHLMAPIFVELNDNDELIQYKEPSIQKGYLIHCKVCDLHLNSPTPEPPKQCPRCMAEEIVEPKNVKWCEVIPIQFESVEYFLGIKGKFVMKFNSSGLIGKS